MKTEPSMQLGYAQDIITPALDRPVFLAGFGNDRRAQTIHDDLTVRALALRTDRTLLVLAALDLIGLFAPDVDNILRALKGSETFKVLNPHVIIASTHTHHGPDTSGLWGPNMKTSGVDAAYMTATKNKIAQTILAALANLKPCGGMKAVSVQVPGLVKNARNPEILDEELTLLQFGGQIGNLPTVTLANFPCHPEVLWEHNPHITADYPGYLRAEVERLTGAPCIFFSGALGGMMTPDVKDHSFEEAEFMGRKLAQEGVKALSQVEGQKFVISAARKEINAKLTNILYKLAFRRKLLPDVRDGKGNVHAEVNLVKIGGLWLATVPGELLPKLGLQLKAWMKASGANVTGIIGLANGWLGYILPEEDFKYPWNPFKPGKHYEETNSIGREIAPSVMQAIQELVSPN